MANVATKNVKLNKFEDRMEVLNKHSTSIKVPLTEKNKYDLLVCELLDTGKYSMSPSFIYLSLISL